MGQGIKTRRSGGKSGAFALISVHYPEGRECSCSDGVRTLYASDKSGKFIFSIPNEGTWTVFSPDGGEPLSADVEITSKGQVEAVHLNYGLILFDNGNQNEAVTGGWTSVGDGALVIEDTLRLSRSMLRNEYIQMLAHTQKPVDLGIYASLTPEVVDGSARLGVAKTIPASLDDISFDAEVDVGSALAPSLDVSKLEGPYYVCLYRSGTNLTATPYTATIEIAKLKLS